MNKPKNLYRIVGKTFGDFRCPEDLYVPFNTIYFAARQKLFINIWDRIVSGLLWQVSSRIEKDLKQ